MKTWLLDTGPVVAYLDARDSSHLDVAAVLDEFNGRLVTTDAVVTEAMHFVSEQRNGPRALAEFLDAARVQILNLCQPESLSAAVGLMEGYADMPMDFADATLVLAAEALRLNAICTLDRRGFSTYRIGSNRKFSLVLDASR